VVDDHRLFVDRDAYGNGLFRHDLEPVVVVELDDFVVGDGLAVTMEMVVCTMVPLEKRERNLRLHREVSVKG
jgi:hypothetical protein